MGRRRKSKSRAKKPAEEQEQEEEISLSALCAEALEDLPDKTVCSFPMGYVRQVLYSCLTCRRGENFVALCSGCMEQCHRGHEFVELHTKRMTRCDCGTDRTPGFKCSLYDIEKEGVLNKNNYSLNYDGLFCVCRQPYDLDADEDTMQQCQICEDWFHEMHSLPKDKICEDSCFICNQCFRKHPWIRNLDEAEDTVCLSKLTEADVVPVPDEETYAYVTRDPEAWRRRICSCTKCDVFLDKYRLSYLGDERDFTSGYISELQAQRDKQPTVLEEIENAVKSQGPEAVVSVKRHVNLFKSEMRSTFLECADTTGVVTSEAVEGILLRVRKRIAEQEEADEEAKRLRLQGFDG